MISRNVYKAEICIILILFLFLSSSLYADLVTDPELKKLVKTTLNLPDNTTIRETELKSLTQLIQYNSEIRSLAGLEYATNLQRLEIYGSHITDLSPIRECVGLTRLGIAGNKTELKDISAIANLRNITFLNLAWNAISNIRSLSGLVHLEVLKLRRNQITDISVLAGLINLVELDIAFNPIYDLAPVGHLLPIKKCELAKKSVEERLADKFRPSVFAAFILGAWGTTIWTPALNLTQTDNYNDGLERLKLYGLYFVGMDYREMLDGSWELEPNEKYPEVFMSVQAYNPNMIFLAGIRMREAHWRDFPKDYPYWLRDAAGERIESESDSYLLNFTDVGMQDDIIEQAIAVADCGLFDGIFFDWWHENGVILADRTTTWGTGDNDGYVGFTAEQTARDNILKGIRENVPEDFLILVNTNRNKIYRTAWGINGTFMETGRDFEFGFPDGYVMKGIEQIEDTLRWSEQHMRYPQINCVEGWGNPKESPDSLQNKQNMRLFTTMHLTHSNGFVLFTVGDGGHDHYWYKFWDTDLGQAVSELSTRYEETDGLFIREFEKGYAVYNRSNTKQTVYLPMSKGVESGILGQYHIVPDLDGEIYLKSDEVPRPDINGDGVLNILDLTILARRFGKSEPDLNGDGIINILDLVIVANNF